MLVKGATDVLLAGAGKFSTEGYRVFQLKISELQFQIVMCKWLQVFIALNCIKIKEGYRKFLLKVCIYTLLEILYITNHFW